MIRNYFSTSVVFAILLALAVGIAVTAPASAATSSVLDSTPVLLGADAERGFVRPDGEARGFEPANEEARGFVRPEREARGFEPANEEARGFVRPELEARGFVRPEFDVAMSGHQLHRVHGQSKDSREANESTGAGQTLYPLAA